MTREVACDCPRSSFLFCWQKYLKLGGNDCHSLDRSNDAARRDTEVHSQSRPIVSAVSWISKSSVESLWHSLPVRISGQMKVSRLDPVIYLWHSRYDSLKGFQDFGCSLLCCTIGDFCCI